MDRESLQRVYWAIKKDNLRAFSRIFSNAKDLNLCFGRFPILSLLYLYGAYRILNKYEKVLMKIRRYEVVDEEFEMYMDFKRKAKKSLKFYANSTNFIEPIEMLAILDERSILKQNYKNLYKDDEIIDRLEKIYKINSEIGANITTNECKIENKNISSRTKFWCLVYSLILFFSALFGVVCVSVVATKTGLGTDSHPFHAKTEQELTLAIEKDVKNLILDDDITLTKEVIPQDFSGTISGNGKTIFASGYLKNGLFKTLSGQMTNLNIEFDMEGLECADDFGLIAKNVTGTIRKVSVNGKLDAVINSDYQITGFIDEVIPDIFVSTFCAVNDGAILESAANISVNIKNVGQTNAYFSAFAGVNNGKVESSVTKSIQSAEDEHFDIITDTVDVAGIVSMNYGTVNGCKNGLSIVQTTERGWSPIVAGIAATNYGTVASCTNEEGATVSGESLLAEQNLAGGNEYVMYVGGVVAQNYNLVESCKNFAGVKGKALSLKVYVGGVAAQSGDYFNESGVIYYVSATIKSSKAECELFAESEKNSVFIGGVVSRNLFSKVIGSGFVGEATAETVESAYIGGVACENLFFIIGFNSLSSSVVDSYSKITFKSSGKDSKETHFGFVFSYFKVSYEYRSQLASKGYLAGNYYVETNSNFSVGEICYINSDGGEEFEVIEDDYNGSSKVNSLSAIPVGVVIYD